MGRERLDAKGDSGDSEGFEDFRFLQIKGSGIGFEGDFAHFREVESFV